MQCGSLNEEENRPIWSGIRHEFRVVYFCQWA